jgi:hypothetical protein
MTEPTGVGAAIRERAAGFTLVPRRPLVAGPIDAWFPLQPGDRPLVRSGQAVVRGGPLAERLRVARTIVGAGPVGGPAEAPEGGQAAGSGGTADARGGGGVPGDHWQQGAARRAREGEARLEGELLFWSGGSWRIAAGERAETLEAPFAGIVREVRPGMGIRLRSPAKALLGREVLAGPASGRLQIATGPDGELRAQHVDVGAAGAIIVAGARMDAEALTRARAVGVRGVIVAGLGIKEQRDFLASERRGSAAVHGLPSFGVLVLDGASRRPIASPVMAILSALEGRTVAIVGDPPALIIDDADIELPLPPPDLVRVRSGPLVGAEGIWSGRAGPRRFPAGVTLEAGFVRFGGRPPVAVPIGDLERYA